MHRDVTPRNILLLAHKNGARWVVGDWGMVRRPRGLTSTLRTRPGDPFGTEGFVAPEVMINAHAATERADVYSLGRVFGFALTGLIPAPNIPQDVPERWRLFVRMLTEQNPERRVQTMADVRRQLRRLLSGAAPSPAATLATLEERIDAGDARAADQLLDLALAAPDDDEMWLDHVVKLPRGLTDHLVATRPHDLVRGFDSVYRHVKRTWRDRSFNSVNLPLRWLLDAAQAAQANADFSTMEEACRALFELEVHCGRYEQRHRTRAWLEALAGETAETVARVVQANPAAARWYLDEGWSPSKCDKLVRDALLGGAKEEDEG